MYNDYQIADTQTAKAMRQKFDEVKGLEIQDLTEIYNKLLEQKENLISNNKNGNLNSAISKVDSSIKAISEIIGKSATFPSNLKTNRSQKNAGFRAFSLESVLRKADIPYSDSGAYGKIGSEAEMSRNSGTMPYTPSPNGVDNQEPRSPSPADYNNTYPNFSPLPSNSQEPSLSVPNYTEEPSLAMPNQQQGDSSVGSGNQPSGNMDSGTAIPPITNGNSSQISNGNTNFRKRNSPLQGSIISNLAKSLFLRKSRVDGKSEKKYGNGYGDFPPPSHCPPRQKLISNQIDVLRILLLFIALRPNCRYISRVANIANTQLEVLMELIPYN